nr:uncharacterized protein LOC127343296 [Lolium perenne]
MAVPDMFLSPPEPCPGALSANSSAITDAEEQQRQQSQKVGWCWSRSRAIRLHTRQTSDNDRQHHSAGLWSEQYSMSQNNMSQSGSPQGALQLTMSSQAWQYRVCSSLATRN